MSFKDSFKKLDDITSENTQRKEPGAASQGAGEQFYKPEEDKKAEIKPATATQASPQPTTAPKMDKERAEKSGAANAYLWGGLIESLWLGVEAVVMSSKVPKSTKAKIVALKKKDPVDLTESEKSINAEFMQLLADHKERKEAAKMSDDDKKAMTYAFTLYAEVTGKETDPDVIKWGCITRALISHGLKMYV